jgi:hypothetical protein
MAVESNDLRPRADAADQVSHRVYRDLIEVEFLHFLPNPLDHIAFLRTQ